ncbi:YqhR family membrane protein [Litchfieldia alkalitelluris]|uniref:YqhR family membrane protein n=1 Tax=Litchfieldia alkalitelluris TaxID=304268 RepID=UPI001F201684|nr:YqhR family membrane protein [Litchfieldia alkalitelluris]
MEAEKKNPNLEQNQKPEDLSMITKVVIIGLFGGLFWSFLNYGTYVFNFTEISPNLVLQPWAIGDWKNRVLGQFIGIAVIGVLSIGVALVYYALLRKFQKIWVGMAFGLLLWALVFFVLNPIFPNLQSVPELGRNTNITTICFYILYGVFIGYSISFEANEFNHESEVAAIDD